MEYSIKNNGKDELLRLTRENNYILRQILQYIVKQDNDDFATNVIANIVADKIMNKQ